MVNGWIFDTRTPDVERFNMVQPYISVVWALQLCVLVDKSQKLWTHLSYAIVYQNISQLSYLDYLEGLTAHVKTSKVK